MVVVSYRACRLRGRDFRVLVPHAAHHSPPLILVLLWPF